MSKFKVKKMQGAEGEYGAMGKVRSLKKKRKISKYAGALASKC